MAFLHDGAALTEQHTLFFFLVLASSLNFRHDAPVAPRSIGVSMSALAWQVPSRADGHCQSSQQRANARCRRLRDMYNTQPTTHSIPRHRDTSQTTSSFQTYRETDVFCYGMNDDV
mmetsp:Transcript_14966/g.34578  ORF Transcript_14966/g.34578 Transcript_14966/m.34578 type:complete len:116 (+) Transcript_14966:3067-3414(+)